MSRCDGQSLTEMGQWSGLKGGAGQWLTAASRTFQEGDRRGPEDTHHTCIKPVSTALQNRATVMHTASRTGGERRAQHTQPTRRKKTESTAQKKGGILRNRGGKGGGGGGSTTWGSA